MNSDLIILEYYNCTEAFYEKIRERFIAACKKKLPFSVSDDPFPSLQVHPAKGRAFVQYGRRTGIVYIWTEPRFRPVMRRIASSCPICGSTMLRESRRVIYNGNKGLYDPFPAHYTGPGTHCPNQRCLKCDLKWYDSYSYLRGLEEEKEMLAYYSGFLRA